MDDEKMTQGISSKKLKAELNAKDTKPFRAKTAKPVDPLDLSKGFYETEEVIYSKPMAAWEVRQRARMDAHKLRGDYPPDKSEHFFPQGLPIPKDSISPNEVNPLKEAAKSLCPSQSWHGTRTDQARKSESLDAAYWALKQQIVLDGPAARSIFPSLPARSPFRGCSSPMRDEGAQLGSDLLIHDQVNSWLYFIPVTLKGFFIFFPAGKIPTDFSKGDSNPL